MKRAGNEGVSGWNETWEYRLEVNAVNGQTTTSVFLCATVYGACAGDPLLETDISCSIDIDVENQISLNNSLWYFLSCSQFPIHSSHQSHLYNQKWSICHSKLNRKQCTEDVSVNWEMLNWLKLTRLSRVQSYIHTVLYDNALMNKSHWNVFNSKHRICKDSPVDPFNYVHTKNCWVKKNATLTNPSKGWKRDNPLFWGFRVRVDPTFR